MGIFSIQTSFKLHRGCPSAPYSRCPRENFALCVLLSCSPPFCCLTSSALSVCARASYSASARLPPSAFSCPTDLTRASYLIRLALEPLLNEADQTSDDEEETFFCLTDASSRGDLEGPARFTRALPGNPARRIRTGVMQQQPIVSSEMNFSAERSWKSDQLVILRARKEHPHCHRVCARVSARVPARVRTILWGNDLDLPSPSDQCPVLHVQINHFSFQYHVRALV